MYKKNRDNEKNNVSHILEELVFNNESFVVEPKGLVSLIVYSNVKNLITKN